MAPSVVRSKLQPVRDDGDPYQVVQFSRPAHEFRAGRAGTAGLTDAQKPSGLPEMAWTSAQRRGSL